MDSGEVSREAARSRNMRAVRRRDTKPEMIVRGHLHRAGLRFRVDDAKLTGRPDLVLARWRAAVFVHGCFWHRHPGCRFASTPATRGDFWEDKFRRNVERDERVRAKLSSEGWRLAVVWECALRQPVREASLLGLEKWIRSKSPDAFSSDDIVDQT